MNRFIETEDRSQSILFPETLEDYVAEDNSVRVIEAFVESLNLAQLGFQRVTPHATGRPGYHPSTLLKIYVYGYLNQIQSSRRLEREAQRNIELIWLTGRLAPDFKTIADFRKDNGTAIRAACREFIVLCRRLDLFTKAIVAIDGSKFKAVNSRDKNFTDAKIKRRVEDIEKNIERYLVQMDSADREEPAIAELKKTRLQEKIKSLKEEARKIKNIEIQMQGSEDKQVSLTDPDARSMKTRGTGIVGYNVQTAVDSTHHLIVAHEVTNNGSDRAQLHSMAIAARAAIGKEKIEVVADRGYFSGEEIVACEQDGITTYLPKPQTSPNLAKGLFDRKDFRYIEATDEYRCPAGERLIWRFASEEKGQTLHCYWSSNCQSCALKKQCTAGKQRRIRRWEHEAVLEAVQARLDRDPNKMRVRRATVEHPFGTLKAWMGATHFLTKRLSNVRTEISLHVLAYNMKRVMNILGIKLMMEAIHI
ncbi:MAG: IS1182 family transposase [Pseudomonadota bacterium]